MNSPTISPAAVRQNVVVNATALHPMQTRVDFEHRHLERLGENAAAVRGRLNSGWPGILELSGKRVADPQAT